MSASTWVFLTLAIVSFILVIVGIILLVKRYDTDAEGKKKLSHAKMWSGIILTIFGLVGVIIFTWLFIRGLRPTAPTRCLPLTTEQERETIGTYLNLDFEQSKIPKYVTDQEFEYYEKVAPVKKVRGTNMCAFGGKRIFELKLKQ